jgi:hypothetical protein
LQWAGWGRLFWWRLTVSDCAEDFLDFVIERESARLRFRKNQSTVSDHVKLSGFSRRDLRLFAELLLE